MISYDKYGSPVIFACPADLVGISDENGEVTLNLRSKPTFYDYYVRSDCSPKEYLERFLRFWKLSREEYEKYCVDQKAKDLSTVLLILWPNNQPPAKCRHTYPTCILVSTFYHHFTETDH